MRSKRFAACIGFGILFTLVGVCIDSKGLLDVAPESPEGRLKTGLSVVMLLLFCSTVMGSFVGPGILLFLGWKAASRTVPVSSFPRPFLTPLFCAVYLFSLALPFLHIPSGTSIRPMTWAAFSFLLAGIAVFISLMQVQISWTRGENWFGCLFAGIASLGLICVPSVALGTMAWVKDFSLSH